MFVLTAEGQRFLRRNTWSTHHVCGVFATREDAEAFAAPAVFAQGDDEVIVLLTEAHTGRVERLLPPV